MPVGRSVPTLPFVLLVVDLMEATGDPESPLNNLEGDGAISILLAEGAQLGAEEGRGFLGSGNDASA